MNFNNTQLFQQLVDGLADQEDFVSTDLASGLPLDAAQVKFLITELADQEDFVSSALAVDAGSSFSGTIPGSSIPSGALNLATAASYGILAYSAITNSASAPSAITGNLGIYPNNSSSVTGFPPGTVSGTENEGNAAAQQARTDGNAALLAGQAMTATAISSTLDGQTLTPGVYKESSGTFNLAAAAGSGILTFNGAGVYIFQCSSTLTTGVGTAVPVFVFTGGATISNTYIYWLVGSSATINVAVTSANAVFVGTVLAYASITVTQGGTVNGQLLAVGGGDGAVTLSNATNLAGTTINTPTPPAATPVIISANSPGEGPINLVFTGSNTINAEIASWNAANPTNQVTLTSGNGNQVPNAQTVSLSGGGRNLSKAQQKFLQNALADMYGNLTAALAVGTNFAVPYSNGE